MITKTTNAVAIPNPFRPGMGLEPPYLADRQSELARFNRYLSGFPNFPRNVRLTGLRGVGKTVLLQRCSALAEDAGWVVLRRECSEHLRQEQAFGLALVEDCRRAVESCRNSRARAGAVIERALRLLGGLSVSLGEITVSLRPVTPHPGHSTLEDQVYLALKTSCESVLAAGKSGLLLCHDEAHVWRDSRWAQQYPLSAFLAAIARAQREALPVMLLTCGLPTLTENLAAARSYSERMFQAEVIGALREPEDLLAFTRPMDLAGRGFSAAVADAVRADSRGYPFYVQFYGALLWDSVEWPAPIQDEDFSRSRPLILEALDRAFFDARISRTSRVERAMLYAIAAEGGDEASLRDVRNRLRAPNHPQVIARLIDKGLVYRPSRGHLAFAVPMFGEYLRRSDGRNEMRPRTEVGASKGGGMPR